VLIKLTSLNTFKRCYGLPAILIACFVNGLYCFADSLSNTTPGSLLQHNTSPWSIPQETEEGGSQPSNQGPSMDTDDLPLAPVEYTPADSKSMENTTSVFIQTIQIEDCTKLPIEEIRKIVLPYENRYLFFSQVQELAERLTSLYVKAGYVNSQVYIPPQNLEQHHLKLKALEVKIEDIILEKARWMSSRGILPRIDTEIGDVFNLNPLTRSIRLINENPDISVSAQLSPGKEAGTSRLYLKTRNHFPVHVTPYWDNLGRTNIGLQRFGVTVTHNNLTGLADKSVSSWNASKSSQVFINQYSLPVGAYGTELGLNFAYSKVQLGGELKPLNITSSSTVFSPSVSQVLWKNERFGLNGQLAFDLKDLNTKLLDHPFQADHIRLLRPSLDGYLNDRTGRLTWNQEIGLGSSTGNSSGGSSKKDSGALFIRSTGSATRIQKLPFGIIGLLRGRYQYSPGQLASVEQFQAGGAYTVRGYSEGNTTGDSGYIVSGELYAPLLSFIPKNIKNPRFQKAREMANKRIQMVSFSDFAQLYTNKSHSGESHQTLLMSWGMGLRFQISRFLVLRVDAGFPLSGQTEAGHRPRIHYGLQSTLF
jgi:hemolysin activation/secretion protein